MASNHQTKISSNHHRNTKEELAFEGSQQRIVISCCTRSSLPRMPHGGLTIKEYVQTQNQPSEASSNSSQSRPKVSSALKKSFSASKISSRIKSPSSSRIVGMIQKKLNPHTFQCGICEQVHELKERVSVGGCEHYFCESCIQYYIIMKVNTFERITCPEEDCKNRLSPDSLICGSLPADIQKRLNRMFKFYETAQNPALRLCANENCEDGVIEVPESSMAGFGNLFVDYVSCQSCHKKYCAKCFLPSHKGPCEESQLDLFKKSHRYRQCKKCQNLIEKGKGCNHMTCLCGYQFCYLCGDEWDKRGHECNYLKQQLKRQREQQRRIQLQSSRCANICLKMFKVATKTIFFIPLTILVLCLLLPKAILKFILMIIASFGCGVTLFACSFIWKRDNKKCAILLCLLYPIIAFVGIGMAFMHFLSVLMMSELYDIKKLLEVMFLW